MPRSSSTTPSPAAFDFPCACATARRAARAVTQLYDQHLRASELEGTQFALLSVLNAIGPCSQASIGHGFSFDKTTLSRNLTLLKKKGWIETAPSEDGRERRYVLSAAGKKQLTAAQPAWQRAQDQLRASMTAKEWNAMWKVFRRLTEAARVARHHLTIALLASLMAAPVLAQTSSPGSGAHDHQAGGSKILMLPRELEQRLAVDALPKPLRDGAAVLILEPTGYVQTRAGTNPFTCLVSRRGGNFYPVCFDEEGTRTILPAFADDVVMRLKGASDAEVQGRIASGFEAGRYRPPARPGI
ncbi:MAG: MarR family winged helix-turn-helix transcriptional regulator, partial [Vicinamibacterales bacterium]